MKPQYESVIVQQSTAPDHAVGIMFTQKIGQKPDTHWHHLTEKEAMDLIEALHNGLESYKLGHTWYVVKKKEGEDV